MLDPFERELGELLEAAAVAPPLATGWEARARSALAAARPTRLRRFTRRSAVIFAAAAAALFGLGFVPVRLGPGKGMLDRAVAAMKQAPNLEIVMRGRAQGKDIEEHYWETADGLGRIEISENGKLLSLSIGAADRYVSYSPSSHTALVSDEPPPPGDFPLNYSSEQIDIWKLLSARVPNLLQVKEWKERSLWRGEVDILEVTHRDGTLRWRCELDPQSGLPLAISFYEKHDGEWELSRWSDEVRWNVDLPAGLWTFAPPPGTKVTQYTYWTGRVDQPVAEGTTDDWQVKAFPLELDPQGNLHLVVLTWPTTDRARADLATPWLKVDGVDDLGTEYTMENGTKYACGYWGLTLVRQSPQAPPGLARTVTLTIHPTAQGETGDQQITFPDLPLPAPTSDAGQGKTEIIQY